MAMKRDSSLHFWTRLGGVTGLLAAVVGVVLWLVIGVDKGMLVALVGAAVLALALVFEAPLLLQGMRSRRGAVGMSVVVQALLALALLVGVNAFAYLHYTRFDLTRDRAFTLDKSWRDQLAQLDRDTTIVVFERHTAFGQSPENPPDNYDNAAERKIIEKVRDLAEQFQDLGPRFRVEVLDIHDDSFEDRLKRIRRDMPKLAEAIDRVKENTIFFYARLKDAGPSPQGDVKKDDGYVQMIGFNDIFELDKKASRGAEGKGRNLVLHDQGVHAFVNKILNIQEKRPKVGFAVAHEFLGVEGDQMLWGMGGAAKALQARGIDYEDIVLKKFGRGGPPTATVATHAESKYERDEFMIASLEKDLEEIDKTLDVYGALDKDFRTDTLDELNKKYFFLARPGGTVDVFSEAELEGYRKEKGWIEGRDYRRLPTLRITTDFREQYLETRVAPIVKESRQMKEIKEKNLEQARTDIKGVNVEALKEQQRNTDLKGKLEGLLADCDLLVIPRLTLIDALRNEPIEYDIHKLEDPQVAAIKAFMSAGKPVLFLFDPPFTGPNTVDEKGDDVDQMLRDLGVVMPAQTVLYDVETESLIQGKSSALRLGRLADVPPVELEPSGYSLPRGMKPEPAGKKHPIRASLLIAGHSVSKDMPNDLRLRNPRPIYFLKYKPEAFTNVLAGGFALSPVAGLEMAASVLPDAYKTVDESAVILWSGKAGWNTDKPFAEDEIPRYTPPRPENPDIGTLREPRRGPFPIGIAVEERTPASWPTEKPGRKNVRFAVIGDGEAFKGETLPPMKERLLLDVANWLMGRDDLLARDEAPPWSFLRIEMGDVEKNIWSWAMLVGLPLAFAYIGAMVMLVRRMR